MLEQNKDELIRASIIQAAGRVFQKWGLNKSTMEDIAHEAGKGKSTLYYCFKSKKEIFDIVVTTDVNRILSNAREMVEHVSSAKEKIKQYIIASLTELKKFANVYSIVRGEIKGNKALVEELKERFKSQEEGFIKEILRRGVQRNEFNFINDGEVNAAAKAVAGIINALELYLFLENEDNVQIDMTAKLISNGI